MSETIMKRARVIYQTVCDIFNYDQSGDCVTSLDLARKQVETLPKGGTFCVPGAGIGTYIYALIEHGVKPQNIWAVECNPKYAELGALMFTRLGVNYIEADYLSWVPGVKFDAIVGNPPYGKNASLAVKFVNKSAELSDSIHYVLPRTFRKPSILNRIDLSLHLVHDETVGDEMFGGTILTCVQKWERRDVARARIETYTRHPELKFVCKAESNVCVGRVGAGPAGKVLIANYGHLTEQHYFLQVSDVVRERLIEIQGELRRLAKAATVGTPSLSKHELISTYVERFG